MSLHLLNDALKGVQRGTDRTASELAIRRLNEELAQLNRELAQREADHTNAVNVWRKRMEPVEQRSHILAVGLTALLGWLVISGVLGIVLDPLIRPNNRISTFFSAVALVGGLILALFAALKLLRILQRGKARGIAGLSASRDKELADKVDAIAGLRRQVLGAKSSLATHRQIVG